MNRRLLKFFRSSRLTVAWGSIRPTAEYIINISSPATQLTSNFRSSAILSAKNKNFKARLVEDVERNESSANLPNVHDLEIDMEKCIEKLQKDLASLHGGRASTDMFSNITIDAYGSKVSIPEVGQISLVSGSKVSIAVFDPVLTNTVANTIRDSGLSLNPIVEGNMVNITIPKPSKEARENIMKSATKFAEKVSLLVPSRY